MISGITDAAPQLAATGNIARGELISIYGTNLMNGAGPLSALSPSSPVSTLGGTSVTIGGLAAPIIYASPTQLDVQVPFEFPAGAGSVNVTVTTGNSTSAPVVMNLVTADLGMFYVQGTGSSLGMPSAANTTVVNASPGNVISIFATGLGAISPAVESGAVPNSPGSNVLVVPPVTINGAMAQVQSAVYTGLGVYTVSVQVPLSADTVR